MTPDDDAGAFEELVVAVVVGTGVDVVGCCDVADVGEDSSSDGFTSSCGLDSLKPKQTKKLKNYN